MIPRQFVPWLPVLMLALGVAATTRSDSHRAMALRAPLDSSIPLELAGFSGRDLRLADAERRVAGVTEYLLRDYTATSADGKLRGFSVYVGYYERQGQGQTIHSPKNCLPGNGWEPLTSSRVAVQTPEGIVEVNRYVLQRGKQRAVVFYWYQGRGRVEADEYRVKRDLLRDAALSGRSEEALVRITIPVTGTQQSADQLAVQVASKLIPAAGNALPL